ncbi:MAG: GGDEF domain-containing protein [Pseudomonadota bacterium]
MLLVATPTDAAMIFAERLRSAIETHVVEGEPPIRYTISLGVAELSPEVEHPEALIAQVDAALYRAKENGRNRVERAD